MCNKNVCISCGGDIPDNDDFCPNCGTQRIVISENYCINKQCERYQNSDLVKPDQMYCGKCGKPTAYGNKILKLI